VLHIIVPFESVLLVTDVVCYSLYAAMHYQAVVLKHRGRVVFVIPMITTSNFAPNHLQLVLN